MAANHSSGPDVIFGQLYTASANSTGTNPDAGPSVTYQGDALLDVRFPYQPGVTGQGRITAVLDSPYIVMVDAVPAAAGAVLAPAAAVVSGTAMALTAVAATGVTPGVPVLPFGAGASPVTPAIGLDMGLATCATTAGSNTISGLSATNYAMAPNQNILVLCGGVFVGATVSSVNLAAGTAVLSVPMPATAASAIIISGNGSGQRNVVPTYAWPYLLAGVASLFDATQALCRGVAVTSSNAADTTWSVTVAGFDLYGAPMSETIAATAGGTAYGRKAFKYIKSATPTKTGGGASTGTFAVTTSDVFGFSVRSDKWEYMNCYWAGSFLTASTGYTLADPTTPATPTTGDVRGTLQLSAAGGSASYAPGGASNGVRRLALFQTLASAPMVAATPANPAPLFGQTQA